MQELLLAVPRDADTRIPLEALVENFFIPETIRDCACEACGVRGGCLAERRRFVTDELPNVLVIPLKRYSNDWSRKITRPVSIPLELMDVYDLKVIIHHSGITPRSGHYYTDIFSDDDHAGYVRIDDSSVSSTRTIVQQGEVTSRTATILLYERRPSL
jgi:uncharacterized UBP type Zn finger protein